MCLFCTQTTDRAELTCETGASMNAWWRSLPAVAEEDVNTDSDTVIRLNFANDSRRSAPRYFLIPESTLRLKTERVIACDGDMYILLGTMPSTKLLERFRVPANIPLPDHNNCSLPEAAYNIPRTAIMTSSITCAHSSSANETTTESVLATQSQLPPVPASVDAASFLPDVLFIDQDLRIDNMAFELELEQVEHIISFRASLLCDVHREYKGQKSLPTIGKVFCSHMQKLLLAIPTYPRNLIYRLSFILCQHYVFSRLRPHRDANMIRWMLNAESYLIQYFRFLCTDTNKFGTVSWSSVMEKSGIDVKIVPPDANPKQVAKRITAFSRSAVSGHAGSGFLKLSASQLGHSAKSLLKQFHKFRFQTHSGSAPPFPDTWFATCFETVPVMLSRKHVFMYDGLAYLSEYDVMNICIRKFKNVTQKNLAWSRMWWENNAKLLNAESEFFSDQLYFVCQCAARAVNRIREDMRLARGDGSILIGHYGQPMASSVDIEDLVKNAPLCFTALDRNLMMRNHLKHPERQQYKDIAMHCGAKPEDMVQRMFVDAAWTGNDAHNRKAYLRDAQVFQLKINSGFRPTGCMRRFTQVSAEGQVNGCPFVGPSFADDARMKALLVASGVDEHDERLAQILRIRGEQPQRACQLHFDATTPLPHNMMPVSVSADKPFTNFVQYFVERTKRRRAAIAEQLKASQTKN